MTINIKAACGISITQDLQYSQLEFPTIDAQL
jgi:hypothetical protein